MAYSVYDFPVHHIENDLKTCDARCPNGLVIEDVAKVLSSPIAEMIFVGSDLCIPSVVHLELDLSLLHPTTLCPLDNLDFRACPDAALCRFLLLLLPKAFYLTIFVLSCGLSICETGLSYVTWRKLVLSDLCLVVKSLGFRVIH
ncbi:UNVERIFIED_CONTAM: hypothetical protein Sindi_0370100 [Sesamum indicum]